MILKVETKNNYSMKVTAIKKKLNEFDDLSFVENMYKHFQKIRDPKNGIVSNFPWCCFLAMKWKFTEPHKLHVKNMRERDFVNIVNAIYNLQVDASDLLEGNKILLSIRRMIINQMLYQASMRMELNTLARQYYWYCNYQGGYFERSFLERFNISLENYYKISAYFLIVSCVEDNKESNFLSVNVYLIHLVPYFGAETLKAFLNLVSVKFSDLRGFMSEYKDIKQRDVEYYQDTPMLNKPMILMSDGVLTLSKHILRAALAELVPSLLKKEFAASYKDRFGKVMEKYVGDILSELPSDVITEDSIKDLYREHKKTGKVVDYIVKEGCSSVYIDSKAIEPEKTVKSSNFALHIKERLKNSFIKGVLQGQECARILNEVNNKNPCSNDSLIIIIHKDHYIPTGKMIEDVLDPTIFSLIEKKHGSLAIKKERIYYMTIEEFERLIEVCKVKDITITSVIDACLDNDSDPNTQKFNVMMHLNKIAPGGVPDRDNIIKSKEYLFDEILESMGESSSNWDGKVEEFLQIRNYLMM
ncbi:hypothetical protein [Rahnella victoriana]|uniref:GapS1 family protein n=1 Tax=Rahnella victoriana TaxID=1510570 RepID=UPI001E65BF1F|nr:hypothetical protein [Rahnella victoriana]